MMKVFLVDDEKIIIEELLSIVDWSKNGYEVCGTAYNAAEALEKIADTKPDIVIADICMNGTDGLEMAERVKKRNADTGIIFLTAYDDFSYALQAIKVHSEGYLVKPVCVKDLLFTMNEYREKLRKRAFDSLMNSVFSENPEEAEVLSDEKSFEKYVNDGKNALYGYALIEGGGSDVSGAIASYSKHGKTIALFSGGEASLIEEQMRDRAEKTVCGKVFERNASFYAEARKIRFVKDGQSEKAQTKADVSAAISAILADMENLYGEKLTLIDYAEKYFYNTSYLSEQFAKQTGETFTEHLGNLRMKKAKELMKNSKISLSEIAFRVGYSDYGRFCKSFKKNTGYSPAEYRRKFSF